MYRKSLIAFILSVSLVVGIIVVLNYEATTVESQIQSLPTAQASCSPNEVSCPSFSLVSASLFTQNTTDLLGIASPSRLSLVLNVSGSTPLESIRLFIGNTSAGVVPGPFEPGLYRVVNFTLPATISASPGHSYLLSVQGFNESGAYVIKSETLTAESQVPYSV